MLEENWVRADEGKSGVDGDEVERCGDGHYPGHRNPDRLRYMRIFIHFRDLHIDQDRTPTSQAPSQRTDLPLLCSTITLSE